MSVLVEEKLLERVEHDRDHECPGFGPDKVCVRMVAVAHLPTRSGNFQIVAFLNNRDQKDHIAIVHGDVVGQSDVVTRLHSECLTGDVMGSLRCDCRDQLEASLQRIAAEPRGVVLYMRQEGRGIGLANKIRAYALQDRGMDTVEANLALGFRDDERDYAVAAHMLHSLGIASVQLMTNNPGKIGQLEKHGVKVAARLPHLLPPTPTTASTLRRRRSARATTSTFPVSPACKNRVTRFGSRACQRRDPSPRRGRSCRGLSTTFGLSARVPHFEPRVRALELPGSLSRE